MLWIKAKGRYDAIPWRSHCLLKHLSYVAKFSANLRLHFIIWLNLFVVLLTSSRYPWRPSSLSRQVILNFSVTNNSKRCIEGMYLDFRLDFRFLDLSFDSGQDSPCCCNACGLPALPNSCFTFEIYELKSGSILGFRGNHNRLLCKENCLSSLFSYICSGTLCFDSTHKKACLKIHIIIWWPRLHDF